MSILDELQVAKASSRNRFDQAIYALTEEAGRTRGTARGGVEKMSSWANIMVTSGEEPITGQSSGGGAVNRNLEIECPEKLFDDPGDVVRTVKENFGFAGREFVGKLKQADNISRAKQIHQAFFENLLKTGTTEKQALAASALLTADALATEWLFQDGRALSLAEITPYLRTKSQVSANQRGYEFVCQLIACNYSGWTVRYDEEARIAYIPSYDFREIIKQNDFNPDALLSWLKKKSLILTYGKGCTVNRRFNRIEIKCIALKMPPDGPPEEGKDSNSGRL